MTLLTIMICQFRDLMLISLLADILYSHCPHDRRCIRKKLVNRKSNHFQKCDLLLFFYAFLLEFGLLQEHYMCLLNILFAFFVKCLKKQFVTQIYWLVFNCVQENNHRCHYSHFSKSEWGNSIPDISSRIKHFLMVSHKPLQNKWISTRNAFKVFCWLLFSIRINQNVES